MRGVNAIQGVHVDARCACDVREQGGNVWGGVWMRGAHPLMGPILRILTLACDAKWCFGLKKPLYSGTLLNSSTDSYTAISSATTSASLYVERFSIMSTYSTCFTQESQTGFFLILLVRRGSNSFTLRGSYGMRDMYAHADARRACTCGCETCMRMRMQGVHAHADARHVCAC